MKSALLRAQVESALGPGLPSPFTFRENCVPEVVSCGLEEIDALTGGLPRGGLTEIVGLASSGRTALALATLAAMTAREEVCAWVDAQDAFDPCSAQLAGADLERLLWARCHNIEQTLRTADLLIQGGGFGMVVLDLSDVAPRIVRRVPLSFWFRFRRAVEHTPTVLVLLEQESCAKTCASLVLGVRNLTPEFRNMKLEIGNWKLGTRNSKTYERGSEIVPPHSLLFCGTGTEVTMIRSRSPQARVEQSSIRTRVAWL
jgi:recombination protein RecA